MFLVVLFNSVRNSLISIFPNLISSSIFLSPKLSHFKKSKKLKRGAADRLYLSFSSLG